MVQYTIIGGSGFIGTRLSNRFSKNKKKFNILDIVDSKFYKDKVIKTDVRDLKKLNIVLKGTDIIINLAAEHKDDVTPKSLYDEVNVLGAKNICKAARLNKINKIIFTSSVAVYGFAKPNTCEDGIFNPFNDYGRTKMEAEKVFSKWQLEDPKNRSLVIIRPTVVFGERNRGNVYNLLRQIANGKFLMIGNGKNLKSMAYVENVASFIEFSTTFDSGIHIFNYADKPDLDMNNLVKNVNEQMGRKNLVSFRIPYFFGLLGGYVIDLIAFLFRKKFPISAIRVKKFCSTTQFSSDKIHCTEFKPKISIDEAIKRTVKFEFINSPKNDQVFYSE